jgi:uracil-DNA glycosylase family 4
MNEQMPLDLQAPAAIRSLRELAQTEQACRRCPLYRDATRAVPGEGRRHAHIMLVGEQPGDKEDLTGKPFVGPAGRMLDQALAEAGIPRDEAFVTNAV